MIEMKEWLVKFFVQKYENIIVGIIVSLIVIIVFKTYEFWKNKFIKMIHIIKKTYHKITDKPSYEIIGMRKQVTVCANGHIIVLQDFKLKINNENAKRFTKSFDVSDGAKTCNLENITNLSQRIKTQRYLK